MNEDMRFSTALRDRARRRLEELGHADIIVGIPSYNVAPTIGHVVTVVSKGLERYFPDKRALIIIADGGSVDDTREEADRIQPNSFNIEKMIFIYRGVPGKGSAIRAILEAADFLKSQACITVDADLVSITPEWIRNLANPVIDLGFDFVTPYYRRYKYDGTITNTIAYNLVRTLYGARVRQPIGGDFAMSRALVKHFLEHDVWETDVARFGIDIWMTTTAIVHTFRICQARLGVKIHAVKDPAQHLGPMFRQVVSTTFILMEQYHQFWKKIRGSKPAEIIGKEPPGEAKPFSINIEYLVDYFKLGFKNFGPVWKNVVGNETYTQLAELIELSPENFQMPTETWAKIIYDFAATFHSWPVQRIKLVDLMLPLYHARVASMVNALKSVPESEAEGVFEEQAVTFEKMKGYLLKRWKQKNHEIKLGPAIQIA